MPSVVIAGTAPGDTIRGGDDTRIKLFLLLNLERTLDKRREKEDGSSEETTGKKRSSLSRGR